MLLARPVPEEPIEVLLEGEGARLFRDWMEGWLARARDDVEADGESVVGYGSPSGAKVRSFALRLILMIHVLAEPNPSISIDPDTVRRILDVWMPFVIGSVERVVGLVRDDPDFRIAERILAWIKRHDLNCFSRSQAFRGLKSRGTTLTTVRRVDDLNGALQLLVDCGWIQPTSKVRHRGGGTIPASSRYVVHPEFTTHVDRLQDPVGGPADLPVPC